MHTLSFIRDHGLRTYLVEVWGYRLRHWRCFFFGAHKWGPEQDETHGMYATEYRWHECERCGSFEQTWHWRDEERAA